MALAATLQPICRVDEESAIALRIIPSTQCSLGDETSLGKKKLCKSRRFSLKLFFFLFYSWKRNVKKERLLSFLGKETDCRQTMSDGIAWVIHFLKAVEDLLKKDLQDTPKVQNQAKQKWETDASEEAETALNRKSWGSIDNHLWTRRQNSFQLSAVKKGSCKDILVQGKEN